MVRAALGDENAMLTRVGLNGNISVLYRYEDVVAKVVMAEENGLPPVFARNHQRELQFYRHTKRYPAHAVHGDVLLMDALDEGCFPNQLEGLSFAQMRRVLAAMAEAHHSLTPWDGIEKAGDVVLGLGYEMASPLLANVTEQRLRDLGLMTGREREAVALMREVMGGWVDLVSQLAGNTVLHGDCRGENVFLPDNESSPAVLIDWQLASIGSPFIDLAYLIVTSLTVAQRCTLEKALVEDYFGSPCNAACWARYRRALRWPVVWAVFVCGGGMDHERDACSPVWEYQAIMTERFLSAALDSQDEKKISDAQIV
jgi:hypothetical protein